MDILLFIISDGTTEKKKNFIVVGKSNDTNRVNKFILDSKNQIF